MQLSPRRCVTNDFISRLRSSNYPKSSNREQLPTPDLCVRISVNKTSSVNKQTVRQPKPFRFTFSIHISISLALTLSRGSLTFTFLCRHQQGNGHRLVRHCQHSTGSRYDEVLEGQAYHSEETGRRPFVIVIRRADRTGAPPPPPRVSRARAR